MTLGCRQWISAAVAGLVVAVGSDVQAQSWITNLVNRAAEAGEKLEEQQKGPTSGEKSADQAGEAEAPSKDQPSPAAAEPAKPAVAEEAPAPMGQAAIVVAAPEETIEPESNWAIIRDLLATDLPAPGGAGPILASLTGEKEVMASAVPVAKEPEESEPAEPAEPATANRPRSTPRAQQARSTPKPRAQRQQTQRQEPRRQQQYQPEPRRSIYNPYSTYSR